MRASNDAAQKAQQERRRASDDPPIVTLREVDPGALWVWMRLARDPTTEETDLLGAVVAAWFALGRLGGFNAGNLQLSQAGASEGSVSFDLLLSSPPLVFPLFMPLYSSGPLSPHSSPLFLPGEWGRRRGPVWSRLRQRRVGSPRLP